MYDANDSVQEKLLHPDRYFERPYVLGDVYNR